MPNPRILTYQAFFHYEIAVFLIIRDRPDRRNKVTTIQIGPATPSQRNAVDADLIYITQQDDRDRV